MTNLKIIFLLVFVMYSCGEIQYDGETKLEITGKLIDKAGNPIAFNPIDIEVSGNIPDSGYDLISDIISYGKSDENGKFTFLIPAPKLNNPIIIRIKETDYLSKIIEGNKNNFTVYKLNLQSIILPKIEDVVGLTVLINPNNNQNKQLTSLKIIGNTYNQNEYLNPIEIENFTFETYFNVFKNQTVTIEYKIKDFSNNATVETFTESLQINDINQNFTITF